MSQESLHTTFNARHLAPKDVAQTFIWSENFGKLIQNNHSIILGARGCGKTTLMKMLTLPALYNWKDERAKDILKNMPFYSIYISTDIYWNVKNQTYGSQLEKYGTFSDKISHFAVNSNVFTSLCDTFLNILTFEIENIDEQKEIELSEILIESWKLGPTIPKLKFVKEALNDRVDEVNQIIQEVIFNFTPGETIPDKQYFNLNFESSLEQILPKFERIFQLEGEKKWALCFDELEFAPIWLQEKLFTSLRSRKQFVLYKLSASPILPSDLEKSIRKEYGPTSGNDLQMIKMWSSGDTEDFTKKLICSFFSQSTDIEKVFGSNEIYNKNSDSYEEGSTFHKQMIELLEKDKSFRDFLLKKKIDVNRLLPTSSNNKDILFRKIKPIVYFRNAFIDNNDGIEVNLRSRKKASELYFGIEVLTKIFDGNPRWLIGFMSQFKNKNKEEQITKSEQYSQLMAIAKKFHNVIANIPVGNNDLTITSLIERIASYFGGEILGNNFKMDPKGTFVVDRKTVDSYPGIADLIEKAISQGAIILLDSENDSFDFNVEGKRFKLSYLFSIIHNLPLRNYTQIDLGNCMTGIEDNFSNQYKLFE
ncbi:hypothetical protein H4O18_06980 [Arenibacter sp. BSSL-BM3]|uniref:Uncharacterized protein n=1 Tax=Arenibacter arenosicollis TaxID=2762274 RepID=A0ABR7QKL8_9FLAO|nr:hypothetical protein [Arenibacter arenosicollis]MBC8767731.1 hypothetical protein [Arenibacter arenosicollis]